MSNNYDFTDLVLLIGTNPLPNYVVADYFLQKNDKLEKIWFLHSEENRENIQKGTEPFATKLQEILQKKYPERKIDYKIKNLAIPDVGNSASIKTTVNDNIIIKIPQKTKVHLNYTGGTKSMGTHTYRAFEQNEKSLDMSYSYLDARKFKLVFDDDYAETSEDLRNTVKIDFANLIELHGYERINDVKECSIFNCVCEKFTDLIKENRIENFFINDQKNNQGYCRKDFRNTSDKTWRFDIDILKKQISTPNDEFLCVLNSLPDDYKFWNQNDWCKIKTDNFKKAMDFIDGDWFEKFVFNTIISKNNENKLLLNDIKINWVIKHNEWQGSQDFELDVIMIKGYQLIGVSCTTDFQKGLCKSKGFEIITRTQQIGGSEAKAILITMCNSELKEKLQNELQLDTGSSKSNILVLGLDDLKPDNLIEKITTFIKED